MTTCCPRICAGARFGKKFTGQRQRWYLLQSLQPTIQPDLEADIHPEFEDWRWVTWWFPMGDIVEFKREVYAAASLDLYPAFSQLQPANRPDEGQNS